MVGASRAQEQPIEGSPLQRHPLLANDYLTTGDAAKLLQVTPRTIAKLFAANMLKGHRVPGVRQDRRIRTSSVQKYCKTIGAENLLMETPPRLVTIGTAAEWMGVCSNTVIKLTDKGILKCIHMKTSPFHNRGAHRRIAIDDLLRCFRDYGIDIPQELLDATHSDSQKMPTSASGPERENVA